MKMTKMAILVTVKSGHGQNRSMLCTPLCCLIFPNSEILDPPLQAYILPRAILILLLLQTCRATNSPRLKKSKAGPC